MDSPLPERGLGRPPQAQTVTADTTRMIAVREKWLVMTDIKGVDGCPAASLGTAGQHIKEKNPCSYWNSALTSVLAAGRTSAALAWFSMMLCIAGVMMPEISDA